MDLDWISTMDKKHYETLVTLSLLLLDAVAITGAYLLAYQLRAAIAFPSEPQGLESITTYGRVILVQVICVKWSLWHIME